MNTPSEQEIHAYVDGRLADERRQAVEFYLTQNPARGREVRGWQRDAQQLRAALSGVGMPTLNPALDPQRLRQRRSQRLRSRLAMAAVLVLAMGIGGIGGWQVRAQRDVAAEPPMSDALQAYRLFASAKPASFDISSGESGQLQVWLDTRFHGAPRLPDLQQAGFHVVGGRLMAVDTGPAAMVLYEDDAGHAITFYIRPPSARGALPRGQRHDGELIAEYGSRNGYNLAMVSHDDRRDARVARDALPVDI
ncbi:MAG: anti-sigma factor [Rhodanobacter sp.]